MASIKHGRRLRSESGAELIEFALVFPLLLFIVMGVVDFGFMFQRYEVVTNAAREGARIAVLPGYTDPDVEARVRSYMSEGGVANSTSNSSVNTTDVPIAAGGGPAMTGKRVEVNYTSQYLFLGPIAGWFGGSFTSANLSAVAVMRDES